MVRIKAPPAVPGSLCGSKPINLCKTRPRAQARARAGSNAPT
jgi:hypothetical protein